MSFLLDVLKTIRFTLILCFLLIVFDNLMVRLSDNETKRKVRTHRVFIPETQPMR